MLFSDNNRGVLQDFEIGRAEVNRTIDQDKFETKEGKKDYNKASFQACAQQIGVVQKASKYNYTCEMDARVLVIRGTFQNNPNPGLVLCEVQVWAHIVARETGKRNIY